MLIHMDGFDHYGDDETNMTDGVYDQVDAEFSLSTINPRTGIRCIRRSSTASNSSIIKDFNENKTIIGFGLAFYIDQFPVNNRSFPAIKLLDENSDINFTLIIDSSGGIIANAGPVSGSMIAESRTGIIEYGKYNHIEIAIMASEFVEASALFFSETFASGNLDSYTFKDDLLPPTDGGSIADFSIISDDYGSAVRVGAGPDDSHIAIYRSVKQDSGDFIFKTVEFKFKLLSLGDDDNGIISFRDEDFNPIFAFGIARQALFDSLQRPNIVFADQLFQPGNPIGSAAVDVDEWYRVEIDYADELFVCSVIKISTETLHGQVSIPVTSRTPAKYLFFENDNATGFTTGIGVFDDIFIYEDDVDGDGSLEIRVNGVTEISESSKITTFTGVDSYRFLSIEFGSSITHGVTTDIDDIYIWDEIGSWNNSFLGDRRCFLLKPNQDTNIADFEPSSGSFGYKMIDDDSPDDDSTYIIAEAYLQSGSPLTGTSEFEIENIQAGSSLISGINVIARASKTDNTSAEIYTSINSGADSLSAGSHVLTTTYNYYNDIYEYDPSSISSFTRDGLNSLSVSITADDLDPGAEFLSPEDSVSPESATDPFFANVVSLLHFNGSDASTTFTDEIGPVWTAFANAQLDTAFPKFGTAAGLFDGTGDYIRTPDSNDWSFGSGDFTIEYQIRIGTLPSSGQFMGIDGHWGGTVSPATQRSWFIVIGNVSGTHRVQFSWSTTGVNQVNHVTTWSPSSGTYYHIAVTRNGNNIRTFVDGVQIGSTTVTTNTFFDSTNPRVMGATATNGGATVVIQEFNGHIDEARITKGVARYTANFTPPSSELPDS